MAHKSWTGIFRRRAQAWPLVKTSSGAFKSGDETLAVVAVCYNMAKQIGNTLRSLSPGYQQRIDPATYRVRVMDNGSKEPMAEQKWRIWDGVEYDYTPPEKVKGNLGVALNRGVSATESNLICLILDGACLFSPGVLRWGVDLAGVSSRTLVDVRCWHLGPKLQMESRLEGYTTETEDQLLSGIEWPRPSYKLFDISVPFPQRGGLFGRAAETTCLFMSRHFFEELGGFDERYQAPGGGLAAADLFWRAATGADRVFTLMGEAVFHQIHGGAATGLEKQKHREQFAQWRDEYQRLSRRWQGDGPKYQPVVAGHIPQEFRPWLTKVGAAKW